MISIHFLTRPTPFSRHEVEQLFVRILKSKGNLSQLRYLSLDGQEIVRVNRER